MPVFVSRFAFRRASDEQRVVGKRPPRKELAFVQAQLALRISLALNVVLWQLMSGVQDGDWAPVVVLLFVILRELVNIFWWRLRACEKRSYNQVGLLLVTLCGRNCAVLLLSAYSDASWFLQPPGATPENVFDGGISAAKLVGFLPTLRRDEEVFIFLCCVLLHVSSVL